ncbi:hypothetical protein [Desulfonatronum sp. SC1]|uniref:hypothetical protein n=1 Tax=Desulfonatronum sp. SC1 TaxID=2109626 RepID=UPI000D314E64|nr:hypothetical protein [Desulfonatronum sp. SC1]PTN36009.1 hypothetical protein C6366_10720 [Desulfonatronum sp. SC1]
MNVLFLQAMEVIRTSTFPFHSFDSVNTILENLDRFVKSPDMDKEAATAMVDVCINLLLNSISNKYTFLQINEFIMRLNALKDELNGMPRDAGMPGPNNANGSELE